MGGDKKIPWQKILLLKDISTKGRSRERSKAISLRVLLEGDITSTLKVQVSAAREKLKKELKF